MWGATCGRVEEEGNEARGGRRGQAVNGLRCRLQGADQGFRNIEASAPTCSWWYAAMDAEYSLQRASSTAAGCSERAASSAHRQRLQSMQGVMSLPAAEGM